MTVTTLQLLNRIEQDDKWLSTNFEWVQANYEKQFIAVKDGTIIANAKTMDKIVKMLKNKGENPAQIFVSFIQEKNLVEIF